MPAALLVIDLQNDLCHDSRRSEIFEERLPTILALIEAFRREDLPVVYTRFELEPTDPQFDRFGDTYCLKGTPGCELIDELLPLVGPVVPKHKHSAFFETELDDVLKRLDVGRVVLCGLQTQICILLTAADAHHRGYDVVVAHDAVISTRDQTRLDALEWINRYVGRAVPAAEIATSLK